MILLKCVKVVTQDYAITEANEKKFEMNENPCSTIYLNLSDYVIRIVGIMECAKTLRDKLTDLHTEISLPSKVFLLEKFFKFRLVMSKDIEENLDAFNKLIDDIKLCGDKKIDEYAPIVLLNVIPDSFCDVKFVIKYGRYSITFDIFVNSLKSKEIDIKHSMGDKQSGEVMHVRSRP